MSLIAITVNLILNCRPKRLFGKANDNKIKKLYWKRGDKWSNNVVYQPLNSHLKTLNNNFIKPCTPLPKMLNDFCSSLSRILWTHESFVTPFITLSLVMIMLSRNRDQHHSPSPQLRLFCSPTIKESNLAFWQMRWLRCSDSAVLCG